MSEGYDPTDMRLGINQAALLIDDAWLDMILTRGEARQAMFTAEQKYREAKRAVDRVDDEMRTHYRRLGADNAVPGRSVPNLIAAAERKLGIGRFRKDPIT